MSHHRDLPTYLLIFMEKKDSVWEDNNCHQDYVYTLSIVMQGWRYGSFGSVLGFPASISRKSWIPSSVQFKPNVMAHIYNLSTHTHLKDRGLIWNPSLAKQRVWSQLGLHQVHERPKRIGIQWWKYIQCSAEGISHINNSSRLNAHNQERVILLFSYMTDKKMKVLIYKLPKMAAWPPDRVRWNSRALAPELCSLPLWYPASTSLHLPHPYKVYKVAVKC